MKTILKSFETLVICITRPETALLRVRVWFVGRGDSRVQNFTKFRPEVRKIFYSYFRNANNF
jgi:hypothetical protein